MAKYMRICNFVTSFLDSRIFDDLRYIVNVIGFLGYRTCEDLSFLFLFGTEYVRYFVYLGDRTSEDPRYFISVL